MSEPKLISPLLDGFDLGAAMGTHEGVTCYPAIKENTDNKYIVKTLAIPASQVQLEALLLTGAYKDPADAMDYFKDMANDVIQEAEILQKLSKLDGFLPYDSWQMTPMEEGRLGYQVTLVGSYKRSLERYMGRGPMTHLETVNLGLDLCQSLTISRRAGYLYVALKPANVFISKGKEYRIGDLGFVPMASLSYTSLPGRYRSPYVPREVQDGLNPLNDTVDTYAVGMILYQVYNDGNLPPIPKDPAEPFPVPSNADYEIAEIIMKALSPKVEDRWHDPMEMGQALVAYMQRNSVNNTPIASPVAVLTVTDPPVVTETIPAETEPEPIPEEDTPVEETPEEVPAEETEPQEEAPPPDEDEEDFARLLAPELEEEETDDFPEEELMEEPPVKEPKKKGWIWAIVLVLILALLGAGGFYYYQNIYLVPIENMIVDGSQNQIQVTVDTEAEDSMLTVICSDTYGNSQRKALENGQATFTDLLPNSQYKIRLEVDGFHELVGETIEMFNTEAQTNVLSFTAITGSEDGSVILSFTVDGSEPAEWIVHYSAEGEEERSQAFTGHTVTIRELTVDQLYTFRLDSSEDLELLGHTTLDFAASRLILAQDLTVVSNENNSIVVRWSAPDGVNVESWAVRCYDDVGTEQRLTVDGQTEVTFSDIDSTKAYTVEVTAKGMTQPARCSITANPITIGSVNVDAENPESLTVTWDFQGTAPEGGWLLMYTLDGSETPSVVKCEEASATIQTRIHGATYQFQIQAADSSSVFNSNHSYDCPEAEVFFGHALSTYKITGKLLNTPAKEGWSYKDVSKNDYTDTFASGSKISMLLHASVNFYIPEDPTNILYVIRDAEGNVLPELTAQETLDWYTMWINTDYHYCELDIPKVPTQPGDYSVSLYFNNMSVIVMNFSITE